MAIRSLPWEGSGTWVLPNQPKSSLLERLGQRRIVPQVPWSCEVVGRLEEARTAAELRCARPVGNAPSWGHTLHRSLVARMVDGVGVAVGSGTEVVVGLEALPCCFLISCVQTRWLPLMSLDSCLAWRVSIRTSCSPLIQLGWRAQQLGRSDWMMIEGSMLKTGAKH